MPKIVLDGAIASLVKPSKKELPELPTQRRSALTFKFANLDPAEHGMSSLAAAHLANPNGLQKSDRSSVHRALHTAPTDSWEIELCAGLALRLMVFPNFEAVQQLGRALLVLKVHKDPMVCEMFFMKHADVMATYKERMPRALEWVSLYDPKGEIVFWAELYQPSSGRRTGSSNSYLTDELCGGFGSRFSMREKCLDEDDGGGGRASKYVGDGKHGTKFLEEALTHMSCTDEEREAKAAAANAAREKAKAKKARQKANRAAQKKEEEAEAQRAAEQKEEEELAALRSTKIAAPPSLQAFDWSKLKKKECKEGLPVEVS